MSDDIIDTINEQLVATNGDDILVMMPKPRMTRTEALRHAAWLVAVSDPGGIEFAKVLTAVLNT